MKRVVPVRSLAQLMHRTPHRRSRDPILEDQIITFARWGARLVRWDVGGNCLERGLIAYRYLGAAGAEPTLVVGLEREGGGTLTGHAWVVLDGRPAGEAPGALDRYTPVFAFGPDGALTPLPARPTADGGRRASARIRPA